MMHRGDPVPRVETDIAGTNPRKRGIVPLSSVSPFQTATISLGRSLVFIHCAAAPFKIATAPLGHNFVFGSA